MICIKKIYGWAFLFVTLTDPAWSTMGMGEMRSNTGIRPNVNISPANARMRKNPKLRPSDVDFDLMSAPLNPNFSPTPERLAQEMAVLVNNLYKRRELDEVNVNSLMRIRFYLAAVYRQTSQVRLKNRIKEAVREITEELRHRLDFEQRYKSGLVKIPQGTDDRAGASQGGATGLDSKNFNLQPMAFKEMTRTFSEGQAKERSAQKFTVNPRTTTSLSGAMGTRTEGGNPTRVQFENLSARSRSILELVEKGQIDVNQLTKKDRDMVNAYKNGAASGPSLRSTSEERQGVVAAPPAASQPLRTAAPLQTGSRGARVNESNVAEAVRATRGRRLASLLEKKYIVWDQLNAEDQQLVNAYRQGNSSKVSEPAQSTTDLSQLPPPPADWIASARQPEQTLVRNAPPPPPPLPRSGLAAPYRNSSTALARPIGSNPNALRTDNVLRSVQNQIDQRQKALQAIAERPDPRDSMQGASDAEWENS